MKETSRAYLAVGGAGVESAACVVHQQLHDWAGRALHEGRQVVPHPARVAHLHTDGK